MEEKYFLVNKFEYIERNLFIFTNIFHYLNNVRDGNSSQFLRIQLWKFYMPSINLTAQFHENRYLIEWIFNASKINIINIELLNVLIIIDHKIIIYEVLIMYSILWYYIIGCVRFDYSYSRITIRCFWDPANKLNKLAKSESLKAQGKWTTWGASLLACEWYIAWTLFNGNQITISLRSDCD